MKQVQYSDLVLRHFFNPQNVGTLTESEVVGIATLGSESNGDIIKMSVRIEVNKITDVKFMAQASCATIAACSLVTQLSLHKTLAEINHLTSQQIAANLALPNTKLHCVILAVDALFLAIENYKAKQYV